MRNAKEKNIRNICYFYKKKKRNWEKGGKSKKQEQNSKERRQLSKEWKSNAAKGSKENKWINKATVFLSSLSEKIKLWRWKKPFPYKSIKSNKRRRLLRKGRMSISKIYKNIRGNTFLWSSRIRLIVEIDRSRCPINLRVNTKKMHGFKRYNSRTLRRNRNKS